jgi:hypothetical protein
MSYRRAPEIFASAQDNSKKHGAPPTPHCLKLLSNADRGQAKRETEPSEGCWMYGTCGSDARDGIPRECRTTRGRSS